LSVVIPTFNRRDYVHLCLTSLLPTQADPEEFEVIVVDDGSTDGTKDYLEEKWRDAIRVVRRTVNVGKHNCPGMAKNVGIKQARGQMVAFLDCDMVHGQDTIARQVAKPAEHEWRLEGNFMLERSYKQLKQGSGQIAYAGCWWCVPRDVLLEIGGYDERFNGGYEGEDGDLWRRTRRYGLQRRYLKGSVVEFYAARKAPAAGKINAKQNQRQLHIAHNDKTIIRNRGKAWGLQHPPNSQE
jgi:glycosyltransferase involved in cell wall biosynthesis